MVTDKLSYSMVNRYIDFLNPSYLLNFSEYVKAKPEASANKSEETPKSSCEVKSKPPLERDASCKFYKVEHPVVVSQHAFVLRIHIYIDKASCVHVSL